MQSLRHRPDLLERTAAANGAVLVVLALACLSACGESTPAPDGAGDRMPEISSQECAVCGMLVRDQPAPRGVARHRDGTEAFACSVGDLLVYLGAPSPHGRASEVLVEIMEPGVDPALRETHAHAWVSADAAWYVLGVERGGIMGPPVLAYAEHADADAAARGHEEARVVDFAELEAWWRDRQR
jgi:copper chaperone NosL